jgi:microcompartment protein CcmK/EutM
MLLAKVVGTVVASQKDERLTGFKFLVLQRLDINGALENGYVVAVDAVGAGVGEVVMYASGSSARQTVLTDKRACDAVIMAIVDTWESDGQVKYRKDS